MEKNNVVDVYVVFCQRLFRRINNQGCLYMKIKIIFAMAVALLLGIPAAQAQNFYVLGSIGQSKIKGLGSADEYTAELTGAGLTGVSASVDDSDTAYKLQLGYQFNKYFALEGGYFDLGKAGVNGQFTGGRYDFTFKASGVNVSALGILPLSDDFSIFGKLGAAYTSAKADNFATATGGGSVTGVASDHAK
ncbi:MAG: outer membrane beta-barrel protein, partial [Gallionellaceae bacterium]|nr:outer membrane beta-barrel protein [Gallionellaceae bacterium]